MRYYIASNPDISAARIALAHAAPYSRLYAALMDMGGGIIFDDDGDIVAYHERHAWLIERRGSARMTHA